MGQLRIQHNWPGQSWSSGPAATWETWPSSSDVQIPSSTAFTNQGEVVPSSTRGVWDYRVDGAFNHISVQKKTNGTMYMFYIGASSDRSGDGGPANRAMGYATSTDGTSWTKAGASATNPLVTYSPNNGEEEGIFSGGIWAESSGLTSYLGAMNNLGSSGSVDGSGDLYSSSDGLNWSVDSRDVIDPNSTVYPGNDELFPFGMFESGGTWNVYYSGKGTDINDWSLVRAHGSGTTLGSASTVLENGFDVKAGGDVLKKSTGRYLLPVSDTWDIRIRSFPTSDPESFTTEATWTRGDFSTTMKENCLFLDRDLDKWFLYWNEGNTTGGIQLATAPMNLTT